jgi:hypothetical protein
MEKNKLGFVMENVKVGQNLVMDNAMIQQREKRIAIRNVMKEDQEFSIVMDRALVLNFLATENAM